VNGVNGKRSDREPACLPGSMELVEKLEARSSALRARDLAELLGVTQQHIYKLAAQGAIPSFRVGTAVRFDPAIVAEWLRRKISPSRAGMAAVRVAV
jgi:excisionase family DNA binding protein